MRFFIWIVFAGLALFWTSLAYAATMMLGWVVTLVSGGAGAVEFADLVSNWSVPSWLLMWVDAQQVQAAQMAMVTFLERFQGAWPGLGRTLAGVEPLVWLVWAFGIVVILLPALLAHWLVRRQTKADAAVKAA
jgi:cytochrome b subunit of formate dehydrogenase